MNHDPGISNTPVTAEWLKEVRREDFNEAPPVALAPAAVQGREAEQRLAPVVERLAEVGNDALNRVVVA